MSFRLTLIAIFFLGPIVLTAQEQTPAPGAPVEAPTLHKPNTPVTPVKAPPKGLATASRSTTSVFFISCFESNPGVNNDAIDIRRIPSKVRQYAEKRFIKIQEISKVSSGESVSAPGRTGVKKREFTLADFQFATFKDAEIRIRCNHDRLLQGSSYDYDFVLSAEINLDPYSDIFWNITFTLGSKKSQETSTLEELHIACANKINFSIDSIASEVVKHMKKNEKVFASFMDTSKKQSK